MICLIRRFLLMHSAFFVSFLVSALFFAGLSARCQPKDFSPVPEDKELLTRLMGEYQQKYKQGLDKLPTKNRKDYVTIYGERWDNIKKYFDKEEVYTSPLAQAWLDSLVAEIVRGNPSLGVVPGGNVSRGAGPGGNVSGGHVFRCFFSRSAVPNAAYVGEGIILFNMGLFDHLDNEAEAAFVLCHEISHFLLRHPENSMDKYVSAINSEELQLQLRKIKNSEYRRNQQLEGMVKGIAFDSRRHSRDHESQADSMAVELLSHTRYGAVGAVPTLAILDSIDTDTLNTGACLQRTFDSPKYRFQKKWIARDEGLLGGHGHLLNDARLEDSLKTHPDCQVRIKVLGPIIQQSAARSNGGSAAGMSGGRMFVVDSARFEQLKALFRYEEIEYAYQSDRYSLSLFLSLRLLQDHPGDPWLVAQVGRLLNGIYSAQKAHTLSKVADLPSPGYPANYNLLLQFIQNLYLDNIASINYNYLHQYHPQFDHYALFKSVYERSAGFSKP
jgi:hypothetical protein